MKHQDTRLRLTIVKTGDTLPPIIERWGDFDRMFLSAMPELGLLPEVLEVHRGAELPAPGDVEAVIITGSPASVTRREPWAERLAAWAREVVAEERFLLGVCYGHQLLAHAIGGEVVESRAGYEVGTIDVELTDPGLEDPLLGAVARGSRRVPFHSTHQDAVTTLGGGAVVLARTDRTPIQAFRVGPRAWGVQFHPEMTGGILRAYVEGRAQVIRDDARRRDLAPEAELERVRASIAETPHGPRLLQRFIELARSPRVERVDRA